MFRCNARLLGAQRALSRLYLARDAAAAPLAAAHAKASAPTIGGIGSRFLASAPVECYAEDEANHRLPVFEGSPGPKPFDANRAAPDAFSTSYSAVADRLELSNQAAETIASLQSPEGASLPNVMYLYDDKGSELFEEITKTPEYYLTNRELSILVENSDEIARFPDEPKEENGGDNSEYTRHFQSLLIELGAGSGKKMRPILDSTERIPTSKCNKYIPVDCSAGALDDNADKHNGFDERSSSMVIEPFHGTNDEAVQTLSLEPGRKTFLFLGSSLGNFVDAVPFLTNVRQHIGLRDRLLVGVDAAPTSSSSGKSVDVVNAAYNDAEGVTERFILNALSVANRVAHVDFKEDDWCLSAKYDEDTEAVQIYTECTRSCDVHHTREDGTQILVRSFEAGDRIFIEQSGKFSLDRMDQLAAEAGLLQSRTWSSGDGYFRIHEFLPDPFGQATQMNNFIMRGLVGIDNLSTRPLPLRNPWAFYFGHIPAFADRVALQLPGREEDRVNFERGIDPDVDDPTKIHRHSACLEEWPSHTEYEAYDREVEEAMKVKVASGGMTADVLMAVEHNDMHHETLMYMGNECPHVTYAPHPFAPFQSAASAVGVGTKSDPDGVVPIPKQSVCLGADEQLRHELGFCWDNEVPETPAATVNEFYSSKKPVTNAEFSDFVSDGGYGLKEFWTESDKFAVDAMNGRERDDEPSKSWSWVQKHDVTMPIMWVASHTGEQGARKGMSVRTLCDGPVPFEEGSGEWPAMVTLYEAEAFCRWRGDGARIMSELEYQAHFADDVDFRNAAYRGNSRWRYRGFVPVGSMGDDTAYGCNDLVGNGWEWTSTTFDGYPGFEPLPTYPEYSTDFFDGRHFVLKGAGPFSASSYIRRSFRNFFQPNYRHSMAKFRLVK